MSSAPMPTPEQLLAHAQFVRAMARGVLGGDDLVEDAVQETWLAALRGAHAQPGKLRSWLGSVGRRRAVDLHRREATRRRHEKGARDDRRETDTSELAARAEVGRNMTMALLALDVKYREVLLLRYYEDLPPREIARRLELPVETVRTRTRRGLDLIRAHLDAEYDGAREWRGVLGVWLSGKLGAAALSPVALLLLLVSLGGLLLLSYVGIRTLTSSSHDGPAVAATGDEAPDGAVAVRSGNGPALFPGGARGEDEGVLAPEPGPAAATFAIRGRALDAGGRPAAGIAISWEVADAPPRPNRDDRAPAVPDGKPDTNEEGLERTPKELGSGTVYTGVDGRYVIPRVPGGSLALAVPSESGFGTSIAFRHWLESSLDHDFHLHSDLVFAGRVNAPGDGPLDLWLDYRRTLAGGLSTTRWEVRRVRLTGDRSFRLNGMRPGTYDLHVTGAGIETLDRSFELTRSVEDEVIDVRVAVEARGRVRVPEGLDPGGSTFWVRPFSGPFWQRRIDVGDDGSFAIQGLSMGKYRVFLRNTTATPREDDYHAWVTEREFVMQVTGEPIDIVVERDQEVGLRIELPADAHQVAGTIEVIGTAADDAPIEFRAARAEDGAVVVSPARFSRAFPAPLRRTSGGEFWVKGMPKGSYTLRVKVPGFDTSELEVDVNGPQVVTAAMARSDGRVVRAKDIDVLYTVYVRPVGGSDWKVLLWRDGRVRITHSPVPGVSEAFLKPGTYVFRIISLAHAPHVTDPISIGTDPNPLTLSFTLPRGAALSGVVRHGKGVVDTMLHLFTENRDGTWRRMAHKEATVRDGEYQFAGLAPGRYRVSLSELGDPYVKEVVLGNTDVRVDIDLNR